MKEIGENRGDDSVGNQSALLLSDDEATEEYISGAMFRMGCLGAVCLGERKKAIIALENAVNLKSDQMAYWLVLGKLQMGKLIVKLYFTISKIVGDWYVSLSLSLNQKKLRKLDTG